ncbi:Sialic acid-binding Ig-like lectin 5 [Frankliniella fusca]|uniref:Sialic acid-binding Ig-like lectin 5 n=1 Tax=Frankliniella fusca TaxID=407009 RepID=A0AAE1HC00_9NEOP|nr:Sialic acid-binding Ig-like lectin 5 [Frankliniella fusca]
MRCFTDLIRWGKSETNQSLRLSSRGWTQLASEFSSLDTSCDIFLVFLDLELDLDFFVVFFCVLFFLIGFLRPNCDHILRFQEAASVTTALTKNPASSVNLTASKINLERTSPFTAPFVRSEFIQRDKS